MSQDDALLFCPVCGSHMYVSADVIADKETLPCWRCKHPVHLGFEIQALPSIRKLLMAVDRLPLELGALVRYAMLLSAFPEWADKLPPGDVDLKRPPDPIKNGEALHMLCSRALERSSLSEDFLACSLAALVLGVIDEFVSSEEDKAIIKEALADLGDPKQMIWDFGTMPQEGGETLSNG